MNLKIIAWLQQIYMQRIRQKDYKNPIVDTEPRRPKYVNAQMRRWLCKVNEWTPTNNVKRSVISGSLYISCVKIAMLFTHAYPNPSM